MTHTKKPRTEPGPLHEAQVGAINDILRAHAKKPQTERMCECGHQDFEHLKNKYCAVPTATRDGVVISYCPCPAFTPKKEEKR